MKRGIICALFAATLYGLDIVYARIAVKQGVSPYDLVLYRVLLPLLIGLPFILKVKIPREKLLPLIGFSMISATVGIAYFVAIKYITVSEAAPLFYTFPLWILLLTPFVLKTRLDPKLYAIFALAFFGLSLIIGFSFKLPDWRGLLAISIAAIGATAQFFLAKKACDGITPFSMVFFVHAIILPITFVLCLLEGGPAPIASLMPALWPLVMVCLLYIFAFAFQMEASKAASPAVVGLVFCFEPVVAMVASGLLLDERLGSIQLIGAGLVMIALLLASLSELRRA